MPSNKRGHDVVVRFYSVEIQADTNPDGPYEPFKLSLSYRATDADKLDPASPSALDEVLKRAVTIEGREHGFAPGTGFRLHSARLVMTRFVPAAQAR